MKNLLYEKFDPKHDFSVYDHIIIGSGIGGLTTATWLARAGHKVAILERHYTPGGFTHSFKRKKGLRWDVGVHYVGNVGEKGSIKDIFDFLTGHQLKWASMGDIYDVIKIKDKTYELPAGKENLQNQLVQYFPTDKTAIEQYFSLIEKVTATGNGFFAQKVFPPLIEATLGGLFRKKFQKYSRQTTLEVLQKLTSNQELIAVLTGQCGNYGLPPSQSSFAAHAIVVNHFMDGGYFPEGGANKISENILNTLLPLGVKVFVNADVKSINTHKKRVKSLTVNDITFSCKSVISNIGARNTFEGLLNKTDQQICKIDFKNLPSSSGHLCLYVGLNKSDAELNLPKYNIWSFDDTSIDQTFESATISDAAKKFSYISFPSAKDPLWQTNHPGTATIQALTLGKYDWFRENEDSTWMKRSEDYAHKKSIFETQMLDKLYELYPQIKGSVNHIEVSSPLSTKHFSNYQHGEIYGLAHTPERFELSFLKPETRIKGLRLVGQDITLVGVAGAMLSGILCSVTILKWRIWKVFKIMVEEKKMRN